MNANNSTQMAYHQGQCRLLALLQQLPQLGGVRGWAKSKKAGSQRARGWRVLGGWCLEVEWRCTPRCVGCCSATPAGQRLETTISDLLDDHCFPFHCTLTPDPHP